jgi:two-component system, NarL family, sensor kinase
VNPTTGAATGHVPDGARVARLGRDDEERRRPGDIAAAVEMIPGRSLALLRLVILPIIFAGDRLVAHPKVGTTYFNVIFLIACLYGAVALLDAVRARPRLSLPVLAGLDLVFICGLTYESGGAFSQLHTAFVFLPLGAAILLDARRTALAAGVSAAAYFAVALLHPALQPKQLDLVVVEGLYIVWVSLAAVVLAVLLDRRRERVLALALQRGRLVAQALDAEERTRRRLAEELHDSAIQNLLAARQDLSEADGDGREGPVARAQSAVRLTIDQLRETVRELHPSVIEQVGLDTALRTMCEQQARRGGYTAAVRVDRRALGVHDQLIASLLRELLVNVTRHAGASSVDVALVGRDGSVELAVADDGCGFDTADLVGSLRKGHIGIASCRERVEALGGTFDVRTAPGAGTRIRCLLPGHAAPPDRSADGRSPDGAVDLALSD